MSSAIWGVVYNYFSPEIGLFWPGIAGGPRGLDSHKWVTENLEQYKENSPQVQASGTAKPQHGSVSPAASVMVIRNYVSNINRPNLFL